MFSLPFSVFSTLIFRALFNQIYDSLSRLIGSPVFSSSLVLRLFNPMIELGFSSSIRAVESLSFNLLDSFDCPGFRSLGSISGLWIKFGQENSTT